MTPMRARSRKPVMSGCSERTPPSTTVLVISMPSSNSRASSALSTGVLPFLTMYFGPRTAWAGFTSMIWPVTSQSKSMRSAARCCLTDGGASSPCSSFTKTATWKGFTSASWPMPREAHQAGKLRVCVEVGLAGVVVVDLRCEKFEHALRGFRRRREERRGLQLGGGGKDDFVHDFFFRFAAAFFAGGFRALVTCKSPSCFWCLVSAASNRSASAGVLAVILDLPFSNLTCRPFRSLIQVVATEARAFA